MNTRQVFHAIDTEVPLPLHAEGCVTKNQILMRATILFACRGYAAVSVRDIADAIGIRPASIYNHFMSKEHLFEEVLRQAEELYLIYFSELEKRMEKCALPEEIFAVTLEEPKKMRNEYTTYAFSLVFSEQFTSEQAWRIRHTVFYQHSVGRIVGHLVRLGYRKDATMAAILVMEVSFFAVQMAAQELMGRQTNVMPSELLERLEAFLRA